MSGVIYLQNPPDNSVTTAKILDANVTPAKLSQPFTASATVALSGTSVDFTNIPSWVKRIDIAVAGMGTNGTQAYGLQIGSSSGVKSTGYLASVNTLSSSNANTTNTTICFAFVGVAAANTTIIHGIASLALEDAATNQWSFAFTGGGSNDAYNLISGGSNTLPEVLDRIRLTAFGDTFNAGSVRIFCYG